MKLSEFTIEQLEEEIKRRTVDAWRWRPALRETYWFVNGNGDVENNCWDDDHIDEGYYDTGNCFPTCEDAELHALRIRSMRPSCPAPIKGTKVWYIYSNNTISHDTFNELIFALYHQGRVHSTKESAEAWVSEFGGAWTMNP